MNPYKKFVHDYVNLINNANNISYCFYKGTKNTKTIKKNKVLIFSPHPDDECIIGGLPLRLKNELNFEVINVAVTLGSKIERKKERLEELTQACDYLEFGLIVPNEFGLDDVNLQARKTNSTIWLKNIEAISKILNAEKPKIIFIPHENDGHKTHIGTHWLIRDALLGCDCKPKIIETEYWHQNWQPNLLVTSSENNVTELITALSCHKGEIARNPYHISLLAWMHDNVRRGSEMIGTVGGSIVTSNFATIYKVQNLKENIIVGDSESLRKFVEQII